MKPEEIEPQFSALLDAYTKVIDDAFFCPRSNVLYDRTILGLTSKAISLGRAICHLVKGGFYGEAMGLSRSSIECFLLVKYISNKEPEKRATEYINFFKAHIYNVEQNRKKYFSKATPPSPVVQQWIKDAESFPSRKSWMPAFNMASEKYDDPLEANRKTGEPYQAMFDYEGLYEKTSHWVHCGSVAIKDHVGTGGEPFKVFDGKGDDPLYGFLALQYGLAYVLTSCMITFRHFGQTVPAKLNGKTILLFRDMAKCLPQDRLIWGKKLRNKRASISKTKKRLKRKPTT